MFQRPCHSAFLPPCCFATTVVNDYDRSIFGMPDWMVQASQLLAEGATADPLPTEIQARVNSVHTRCIVKTGGFTRAVCKNRGFY